MGQDAEVEDNSEEEGRAHDIEVGGTMPMPMQCQDCGWEGLGYPFIN